MRQLINNVHNVQAEGQGKAGGPELVCVTERAQARLKVSRLNLQQHADLSIHERQKHTRRHKELEQQGNTEAVQEQDCSLVWDGISITDNH